MAGGKKIPQFIAAITLSIGAYGFGTVLGWSSNITDDLENGQLNNVTMTSNDLEMVGSFANLGAIISCLFIGFLADLIGRKYAAIMTVIPFTAGWILILSAINVKYVYYGRLLTGLGGGAFVIVAPIYTTEIAEIEIRGVLGIMMQVFIVLGVLHGNLFGWALPMVWYNVVNLFIPIFFGITFSFQPETPFYSLKSGKPENAEKGFKRLRGDDYDFSAELNHFKEEIAKSEEHTLKNFFNEMKTKAQIKAIIICFMLMLYQQFSGINAIVFYAKKIFIETNTPFPVHVAVILTGIISLIGVGVSVLVIDRFGRTILLIGSAALCAIASIMLAVSFSVKTSGIFTAIPVVALFIFLFGFNMGLGPIPWLACSELLAPVIKAKLSSIAGAFNWLLSFLVTRYFFSLSQLIGFDGVFYFFASISISCVIFIVLFIPETKNKAYEDLIPELEKVTNFS